MCSIPSCASRSCTWSSGCSRATCFSRIIGGCCTIDRRSRITQNPSGGGTTCGCGCSASERHGEAADPQAADALYERLHVHGAAAFAVIAEGLVAVAVQLEILQHAA